jgi:hypothetical protein
VRNEGDESRGTEGLSGGRMNVAGQSSTGRAGRPPLASEGETDLNAQRRTKKKKGKENFIKLRKNINEQKSA